MDAHLLLLSTIAASCGQEEAPALDPVFFEERVAPLVRSTCASSGCHGGSAGAGNLKYEQAGFGGEFTEAQRAENLRASLAFVRPGKPEESLLYRKSIREGDGGLPHGGRSYAFAKDSEEARAIAGWILGERIAGLAPIAEAEGPATASPGARVRLDGSASRDRRGAPLRFRWTVASSPQGSRARIEDAERAQAWFVPDLAGTYALALAVSNGEAEASATVPISVEVLPFVRLEAESADLASPFEAVPDASASGGAFLSAPAEGESRGTALWRFEAPEAGEYELWVRARAPSGSARLAFSLDGGPPARWETLPSEGWSLAPAAASGSARRTVASGTWEQRDGGLLASAGRGRPALAYLDVRAPEATVEVTVGPRAAGRTGGALVEVAGRDRALGVCAGIDGGGRFVIAASARGRLRPLAEAEGPTGEGPATFRVAYERGRVRLLSGESVVLERDLPAPPLARMGPGARRAPPPPPQIALFVPEGSARFEEVRVRARGEVVYEDRFEGSGKALSLAKGSHSISLATEEGSPAIDEILLARAGAASRLSPEGRRFARGAYLDLLRRTPTEVELLALPADPASLAARLAGSLEFWRGWFEEELYHFLLIDNFRPADAALAALPVRLANGSTTVAGAVREIVISPNFNARNPGPDTFVTVVLEQLLGMRVQDRKEALEAGKRMYDGRPARLFGKEGSSQADFVAIAMAHEDFAPTYLGRFHRSIFGAPLAADDPSIARFRADPASFAPILRDWVASPAYAALLGAPRAKSDPMFVRSLFVDLLGRAPSYREFRNMRNALQALSDPSPVRAVLGRVFVDSGKSPLPAKDRVEDPEAWVEAQFLRFFARRPTAAERDAFAAAWDDPACTPVTVVTALVTSREYQLY